MATKPIITKEPLGTISCICPNCHEGFKLVMFDGAVIYKTNKRTGVPRRARFYVR